MKVFLLHQSKKTNIGNITSASGLNKGGLLTINGKEYAIHEIGSDYVVVKKQLLLG